MEIDRTDSVRSEASLCLPSGAVFAFPPRRARLVAVLPLRTMAVAVVAFGCDGVGGMQDLVAFVGPDASLLALERLTWQGGPAGELGTRVAMMPDREHVSLQRSAAHNDGGWRRESWTDYLKTVGLTLRNAPPRPVLPGTWQYALSVQREEVAARIGPRCLGITPELLAAFRGSALL